MLSTAKRLKNLKQGTKMSNKLAQALAEAPTKKRNRAEILALIPAPIYDDGRTKQSFRDECDINAIMDRAAQGGTITHLAKWEGIYADFSEYDFQDHNQKLTKGREIFDDLPAEIRREFGQSPQAFFDYVNDPKNIDILAEKLPGLAKPGTQLKKGASADADADAAQAAADKPASEDPPPTPEDKAKTAPPDAGDADKAT